MENEHEKPGYYAIIPAPVLYNKSIPSTTKLIYAVLSSMTGQTGYCYASNGYLTKHFGISVRTLQDHLQKLKKIGAIRIEDGDGGAATRKIYCGINPLNHTPAENCGGGCEKLRGTPAENCGENNKENKKTDKKPPKAPQGAKRARKKKTKLECEYEPEIFERLWKKYPRDEGKGEARYAWDELKPDRKLMMEMSDALDRHMRSDEWRRGVGIPWLVRWLKERRWEWHIGTKAKDEPEPEDEEVHRIWLN